MTETATIVDLGMLSFDEADEMNIPVNIFLTKVDKESAKNWKHDEELANCEWELVADNFMPRKNNESTNGYHAVAPTREALVELLKKHVLPLYQAALNKLNAIAAGTEDSLYYWEE